MKQMGYRLGRVEKGYCEVILPHSNKINNQAGGFHGGAIGTIGDISAGYAGLTVAPEGMEVTTVEYKINFLSAFTSGTLVAVGRVVKPGKRLLVTTAEIFHINGEYDPMGHHHHDDLQGNPGLSDSITNHEYKELPKGTLCAILQMTLLPIPKTY
jgi:uncharacterized protein (TIGR00369 family)